MVGRISPKGADIWFNVQLGSGGVLSMECLRQDLNRFALHAMNKGKYGRFRAFGMGLWVYLITII